MSSASGFTTKDVIQLGVVAGIGYALYTLLKTVGKAGAAAAGAATNWTSDQIAQLVNFWDDLGATAPMQVQGNVLLPNGQSIPVASLTVRQDAQGNVYFQTTDKSVWQISPGSDAQGNWSASIVPPPNFGVTGSGW